MEVASSSETLLLPIDLASYPDLYILPLSYEGLQ